MFQLKRMNFGFVRHTFRTNDGIEHVKTTYFIIFFNGERQASLSIPGKLDFHHKIDTSRTKASFFKQ